MKFPFLEIEINFDIRFNPDQKFNSILYIENYFNKVYKIYVLPKKEILLIVN